MTSIFTLAPTLRHLGEVLLVDNGLRVAQNIPRLGGTYLMRHIYMYIPQKRFLNINDVHDTLGNQWHGAQPPTQMVD